MKKLPCRDCGAMILPTTAESTGGLCMACKQGIRAQLDQSRKFYESQKRYDPHRALWTSLVKRSSEEPTLSRWSTDERIYFCVSLLEGEIYNGGFDQFFTNSSGDYYHYARDGLIALKAVNSHSLLVQAAKMVFNGTEPPKDRTARLELLLQWADDPERHGALEQLDRQFWADPDNLADLLIRFANEKGLVTPFLDPPE